MYRRHLRPKRLRIGLAEWEELGFPCGAGVVGLDDAVDPHGPRLREEVGQPDHAVAQDDEHHAGVNRHAPADARPVHALFPDPVDGRGEPRDEKGDAPHPGDGGDLGKVEAAELTVGQRAPRAHGIGPQGQKLERGAGEGEDQRGGKSGEADHQHAVKQEGYGVQQPGHQPEDDAGRDG